MANEQMENDDDRVCIVYDDCESIVIVVPHCHFIFCRRQEKKAVENTTTTTTTP